MRALYKIILLGVVLVPLIFTSSSIPLTGTFASLSSTKNVDATLTAAVWDTQVNLVGLSDLSLTGNGEKLNGITFGTKGNPNTGAFDENAFDVNSSNTGSSANDSINNYSAEGKDTANMIADNLTADNLTADNLTADNETGKGSFGGSTMDPEQTSAVTPVADFGINVIEGYAPLSVQFTDLSENAAQWDWDFGDGAFSTEQNPAHTYSIAGTYNVNLIVTNENGTDSKFETITALEQPAVLLPPVANFTSSVTRGFVPLTVQFTDLSGNATQWNWDFGDGNTSTEQNPMHTYFAAGSYKVTLTASNAAGSNALTKTGYIKVGIASSVKMTSITLDGENSTGFAINSGASTTNAGDSFGQIGVRDETGVFLNQPYSDGSLGEVSIPLGFGINNFTLFADGIFPGNENYGAVLFFDGILTPPQIAVYNSNGKVGKFSVQAAGTNIMGSANGGLLLDKAPGTSVYTAPDGTKVEVVSFVVDSKNGITDEVSGGSIGSNGIPETTAKLSLKVTPSSIIPLAAFSASPTSGNAPLNVAFTDASKGSPTSWSWNFGDGTSSTEQNPAHTYSAAGDYTVNLTSSNANGTDSKLSTIKVLEQPAAVIPVADFNSNVTSGYVPLTVQFADLSKNAAKWNWDFGDGATSTEQSPAHTYSAAGNYTVTLTVSNTDGQNTKTSQISVENSVNDSGNGNSSAEMKT